MEKRIKYKRTGRCKQCGVCCMIKDGRAFRKEDNSNELELLKAHGYHVFKKNKKSTCLVKLTPCNQLYLSATGKYKCKLQGKNKPKICKDYPYDHPTEYYKLCKKFCGFKFVKK